MTTVAQAYSATGAAWQAGPGRIYDHLAEFVVAACPGGVRDRRVLDLGAGTGAASRAVRAAGATAVFAVDVAAGMLAHDARRRPPAAVGAAERLPLADDSVDAVVAAFSLNHLAAPVSALVEALRVTARGGGIVVSAYADDDTHPVKGAVDGACSEQGWTVPDWYGRLRRDAMPRLASAASARKAAAAAGLDADVTRHRIPFPDLGPDDLVAWRMGMAHVAPFLATLTPAGRERVRGGALDRLGPDPPELVRSVLIVAGRA